MLNGLLVNMVALANVDGGSTAALEEGGKEGGKEVGVEGFPVTVTSATLCVKEGKNGLGFGLVASGAGVAGDAGKKTSAGKGKLRFTAI